MGSAVPKGWAARVQAQQEPKPKLKKKTAVKKAKAE